MLIQQLIVLSCAKLRQLTVLSWQGLVVSSSPAAPGEGAGHGSGIPQMAIALRMPARIAGTVLSGSSAASR